MFLRNALPKRYQVPAKYWYNRVRGMLEAEMAFLPFIVRTNLLAIDVGGNRGNYAYQLWRLGARVEVFEPNPSCARVLSAWAAGKAVNVHPVALSSRSGSANLHIPIDESGTEHDASASIERAGFPRARDEVVPVRTLDSYGFRAICLIKVDVEGHEASVIEGATATIASSRPALLVEIEQRHNAGPIERVFAKVLGRGYLGYFISRGALTPLEQFELAQHQSVERTRNAGVEYINNFLFLHRARVEDGEYAALVDSRFLN